MLKGLVLTYDEYDRLCELGESLFKNIHFVPSMKIAKRMNSPEAFPHFLSFLICIIEGNDPANAEEKEIIKYMNSEILKHVVFVEKKKIEIPDEIIISGRDIASIYNISKMIDLPEGIYRKTALIYDIVKEFSMISFGISYMYYLNYPEDKKIIKKYKDMTDKCRRMYVKESGSDYIHITKEEYDELKKNLHNFELYEANYIPSIREIEEILVPNIENTYEYLFWIALECKKDLGNKKKEEIYEHIKNILRDSLYVGELKTFPWFEI